jgi:general secretion pathway protein L
MAFIDALQSLRRARSERGTTVWDQLDAWRGQLAACVPRPLRPLLVGRDRRLLVLPQNGDARLYLAEDDSRSLLGELNGGVGGLPDPAAVAAQVQRTVVVLPADQVLRRSLSFPAQVRENLPQVIRYEMDRLSPFPGDQVYFDTRLGLLSRRGDRILVELALCPRDRADPWLQRLREIGLPVDQVTWEGAWPRANLLPMAERPRRSIRGWTWTLALGALVLLLAAAALITPLWQREQVLDEIQAELTKARNAAQQVDKLRGDLERARQGSVAVLQRKTDQPRMIDLLRELTVRLPDGTWIQNLDLDKGGIQMRGESSQATALIALLEKSSGVHGVSFASPVTQVAQTGAERFNITFQYARPKPP